MNKIWKEKEKHRDDELFERAGDGPPQVVLIAVALLSLFFLSGAIYLLVSGPFTGIEVIAPAQLQPVTVAIRDYCGNLLGLEKARDQVKAALEELGIRNGISFTVFQKSPLFMRPIEVHAQVGYILPMALKVKGLPTGIRLEKITPGNRLVVRVRGKGNFTGNKAYRAGGKELAKAGLRPAEGQRFEVKVEIEGKPYIEHWIPVR
ncbi:hypothetical protein KAR34_03440 [bacterium]|nr:hypothetical protein [bacterium]